MASYAHCVISNTKVRASDDDAGQLFGYFLNGRYCSVGTVALISLRKGLEISIAERISVRL